MVCVICGDSRVGQAVVVDYQKCMRCGHELKIGALTDTYIVNDALNMQEVQHGTTLEKFKIRCVTSCAQNTEFLVDIGSSSGKFLYHIRPYFKKIVGIEITPACVAFCAQTLQIPVETSIASIATTPSVVTLWHSLEHIPVGQLDLLFQKLASLSNKATRIVVSVPNADTLLYTLFKSHYTYYDTASHVHQFSQNSLDLLFSRYGFEREKNYFSFAYSFFGYLQTLLNVANPIHNFLYFYLKRGRTFKQSGMTRALLVVYNLCLGAICVIPALLGTLYDRCFKKQGVVQTVCFRPAQ